MSTSPETSPRTTGAHRERREARDREAARTLAERPPARYEPYLDGLFTYCLAVLCDHDAAVATLGDALAFAERRGHRMPDEGGELRAWLYALARWSCLRRLTQAKQKRHASGERTETPAPDDTGDAVREQRRRELALLAWPEAAGTSPEQREALELAVRHRLSAPEVAAVLGKEPAATRELLSSAACEVERTRAALAVVETGGCPGVARLADGHHLVLSAALRRELVRHVDDCPVCRRAAERAAPGRWPGAAVTPAELPVLEAPRAALYVAMTHVPRARGAAAPRYDRRGFPMDPKDRAARRDRLRARAVTTTVVATVVAAPVLALWAAYRGEPLGEGAEGSVPRASEAQRPGAFGGEAGGDYQNAGNTGARSGADRADGGRPDVSVEVISVAGAGTKGAARLTVSAAGSGDTTLVTLTAARDGGPVRWSATTGSAWLYLSKSSGTLDPGESITVKIYVDPLREPSGAWHARVAIAPAGAIVSITGYGPVPGNPGTPPPSSDPSPTPTASPSPSATPSTPPTSSPEPSPSESSADPGSPSPSEGGGEPTPAAS
ncbi:BACON domain-containing protein [Streptomyces niveiscabiei]|uniref:BACON domain-containing protein n=1 Tax=Streptomyces niveiscabiei TaxID=164115 RepID=UPI003EBB71BD